MAVSRDISVRGIAMFHTRRVAAPRLALEITDPFGATVRVIMNLLRCEAAGDYFELAGSFTRRLSL
jgi:hypothetical protein